MHSPQIIHEDNHIIAVNKQTSDLVQGDITGDASLQQILKLWLKQKYNKPGNVYLGVIHRIDRPVSGVVIFAKTSKALTRMNNLFKTGDVKKTYWAIVGSKPENDSGYLVHHLKKNPVQNKSYVSEKAVKGSKQAILSYKLLYEFQNYYLLEINLETGRHHQIRCQLAKIGCPVLGDLKYGFPRSIKSGGIGLHSRKIAFTHPVSLEPVVIIADPSGHRLWDIINMKLKTGSFKV